MQQSFSSETEPVLWKTYPPLEFISQVWDEMLKDLTYVLMQAGIEAGLGMIHKYTSLAKASNANIVCLGRLLPSHLVKLSQLYLKLWALLVLQDNWHKSPH